MDPDAEQLLREVAPQVLCTVIRRFRDFTSAEDAVQEALVAAAMQWPREGVPDHPRAWLIEVASRRMTDHQRGEMARRCRETGAATHWTDLAPAVDADDETDQDDSLKRVLRCLT